MAAQLLLLRSKVGPLLQRRHHPRQRRRAAAGAKDSAPPPLPPRRSPPPPPPPRERHTSWLRRGAPDAPGSPFHELGLAALDQARAPKRRNYALLQRGKEEEDGGEGSDGDDALAAAAPLFVDVGCGSGRFLLLLARRLRAAPLDPQPAPMMRELLLVAAAADAAAASTSAPPPPKLLLLGVDAQPALVARANAWARALLGSDEEEEGDDDDARAAAPPPPRCRFIAGDAPRVVGRLAAAGATIVGASINFPDPVLMVAATEAAAEAAAAGGERGSRGGGGGFGGGGKRLRRCPALSDAFARSLGACMRAGAPLLVQSECEATADAAVAAVARSGAFEAALPPATAREGEEEEHGVDRPWCWPYNPLGVPTEREVYLAERARLEQGGRRVWRALFRARGVGGAGGGGGGAAAATSPAAAPTEKDARC